MAFGIASHELQNGPVSVIKVTLLTANFANLAATVYPFSCKALFALLISIMLIKIVCPLEPFQNVNKKNRSF